MKIYIQHDKKGNIQSVSVPSKHPRLKSGIVEEKNETLREVDTPLIKKLDEESLHNIMTNFVVDLKAEKPALIPRKKTGK